MKKYYSLFLFFSLFCFLLFVVNIKQTFISNMSSTEEDSLVIANSELLNEIAQLKRQLEIENVDTSEVDTDVRRAAEEFMVKCVRYSMIPVTGGSFMMCNKVDSIYDDCIHPVRISSFFIGKTEVTQGLWNAVMRSNSANNSDAEIRKDSYPVVNVDWFECQQFIAKLNSLTGQEFRLPTEAEWEYAARGGKETLGFPYSGEDYNRLNVVAVFRNFTWAQGKPRTDSPNRTASLHPNELGLYDMSGNVWEWCQDWYERICCDSFRVNPTGPPTGTLRVMRGGSCNSDRPQCLSSYRWHGEPSYRSEDLGFRLALSSFKIIPMNDSLHVAIDLGLPSGLKWATCNVGAESPEDAGDYFAWGETEGYKLGKTEFSWATYKWINASNRIRKYTMEANDGDQKKTLEQDDAAYGNWGGNWRMPTREEWEELCKECSWTWVTQNGVCGYKVTGSNGKSIFLPASGGRDRSSLLGACSEGYYWSSSLEWDKDAYCVKFTSGKVDLIFVSRYFGLSIRPVCRY